MLTCFRCDHKSVNQPTAQYLCGILYHPPPFSCFFFLLLRVTCCFWRCNCMTLDVEVSSVHVSSPLCSPSIYFLPCSSFVSTEKIESRHFLTYHTSCFCGTNWAEASCIDFFKMIDGWVQGVLAKGLFILTCALALICTSANCFLLV